MSLCFTGCGVGGSGAETQSSLPTPENDGITISSPDSLGLVTVTGAEAVPAGTTVIIDVNPTSALNLLPGRLWELVVPPAYAETCTSDLPECPDVNEDERCQYTADAEGSFTLRVPADATDTIAVVYLDPATCSEVAVNSENEAYDIPDDGDVLALTGVVENSAFDGSGYLYAIGYAMGESGDSITTLNVVATETREVRTHTLSEPAGTLDDISHITSAANDAPLLFVAGLDAAYLKSLDGEGLGGLGPEGDPLEGRYPIVDTNGDPQPDLEFLAAADLSTASTSFHCGSLPLEAEGRTEYTRLIFSSEDTSIVFIDYQGNPDGTYDGYVGSAGLIPHVIVPTVYDPQGSVSYGIRGIHAWRYDGENLRYNIVLSLEDEASGAFAGYYYFSQNIEHLPFCDGNSMIPIKLDLSQGFLLYAEELTGGMNRDMLRLADAYVSGGSTSISPHFMVFSPELQGFKFVNSDFIENDVGGYDYSYQHATYDGTTATLTLQSFGDDGTDYGASRIILDTLSGELALALPLRADSAAEFFVIGRGYGGSDFIVPGDEASVFEPSLPLMVLAPKQAFHHADAGMIIVRDAGLITPEDVEAAPELLESAATFIRFYGLEQ